jgi:hypothetical protein
MSGVLETKVENHVPDRSLAQRMDALERANDIRIYRAQLKRDIKAGRKQIVHLLENPPEKIESMKVFDLLLTVPKLGRIKVDKMIKVCRMSPSKTVGGLSDRQRNELVDFLRRR